MKAPPNAPRAPRNATSNRYPRRAWMRGIIQPRPEDGYVMDDEPGYDLKAKCGKVALGARETRRRAR